MKIKLVCVGGVRDSAIASAIDMYAKRIGHYWPFSIVNVADVRSPGAAERQKSLEGAKLLAEVAPGDCLTSEAVNTARGNFPIFLRGRP